jgi:hypothetical protein
MSRIRQRLSLESALRLSLRSMFARGALAPATETAGTWIFTRNGVTIGSLAFTASLRHRKGELNLKYVINGVSTPVTETIALETTPLNFGGRRWWFRCPSSGERALFLYKFPQMKEFCSRRAIAPSPTYWTQRRGGLSRIHEQRRALRRKLGDTESGIGDDLQRPSRMRSRTFAKYLARDDELARREDELLLSELSRVLARDKVGRIRSTLRNAVDRLPSRSIVDSRLAHVAMIGQHST